MNYIGKNLVITGASTGIGYAIASEFHSKGANIIVLGRNKPNITCEFIKCNMENLNEIKESFKKIDTIDILINNAGICKFDSMETTDEELFDKTMNINLKALFFVSKEAVSKMSIGATIINISSVAGESGAPNGLGCVYNSSKSAVTNLTKSFARELGPKGIRVNALAPGIIDTPIYNKTSKQEIKKLVLDYSTKLPLGRIGTPNEIAHAALFLVENTYISGSTLIVDGGMSA